MRSWSSVEVLAVLVTMLAFGAGTSASARIAPFERALDLIACL